MEQPPPFPPETDPNQNLPASDEITDPDTDDPGEAGAGVPQEAVDAAGQPDVDGTNEG